MYNINETGIYTSKNVYHDDVEYTYHVKFDDDIDKMRADFSTFCESLKSAGGDERIRRIKALINVAY